MNRVVVIGAGLGGLASAAVLARAGLDVTVLEAQVYPGGCASTFYHQAYRFDSGATLAAGFYPGGPMDLLAEAAGIPSWPARPHETAMVVHLPDGSTISRYAGERRWQEYRAAFGQRGLDFFRWQEQTADALWNLALRSPAWPPQTLTDFRSTLAAGAHWLFDRNSPVLPQFPDLALDAVRPVAARLRGAADNLRQFVDGQLLISAQTTSKTANALYGAAALDLPRRGVVALAGGMGAIADRLVEAVRLHGGRVLFRQEVTRIRSRHGRPVAVETRRGESYPAEIVIANLTPWNAAELFKEDMPAALRRLPAFPRDAWGAFMVYVGLDGSGVPEDLPLHHQVIAGEPLGEGNSVFASLSPGWDDSRAPAGQRALTLSTHTRLEPWWRLREHDHDQYLKYKVKLTDLVMSAAEKAIAGLRESARLILSGTPITFQRFTRRKWGWVGGFPQTNLLRTYGPRLAPGLWLAGDSIFPGQSTAAVILGGLRVAKSVLEESREAYPIPESARVMPLLED